MGENGIVGKWSHVKSEKFDEFLREAGANFLARQMATKINPTLEITRDENKITIKSILPIKTSEESFTIGEAFDSTFHHNGKKCRCTASMDEGKLIVEFQPAEEGDKEQKVTREVVGDELIQTMTIGDVVCKRTFKRVPVPEAAPEAAK